MSIRPGPTVDLFRCFLALLFWATAVSGLAGQQQAPAPSPPSTVHPQREMVEVPTLVMDRWKARLGLRAEDFTVVIDSGVPIHPVHARVQGDDPLTVGVLVDANGALPAGAMAEIAEAFSAGLPALLTARDRVLIYTTECSVLHRADVHTIDGAMLRSAFRAMFAASAAQEQSADHPCEMRRFLDAVGLASGQMGKMPGRRVLLILGDGADRDSVNSWDRVRDYAASQSVSIFGFRWSGRQNGTVRVVHHPDGSASLAENPLASLCRGTGGVALDSASGRVGDQLQGFFEMIRNRYILEFEGLGPSVPGLHYFSVRVPDRKDTVLAAGVSRPMQDAAEKQQAGNTATGRAPTPAPGSHGWAGSQ